MSIMDSATSESWGRKRRPRPCSASYIAVRDALYQLTRLNDFRAEKIGGGFYADVFKVGFLVSFGRLTCRFGYS